MFIIEVILVVGALSILSELFVFDPLIFNKYRRQAVIVPALLMLFMIGALLVYGFNPWSIFIILSSVYRLFNLLRIRKSRMYFDYLRASTRVTSLTLISLQLVVGGLYSLYARYGVAHFDKLNVMYGLVVIELILSLVLLISCYRTIRKTRPPILNKRSADYQLPTLSICVPARNETSDLEECLNSIVSSDYPKLEVVVLDDCSQGKYTSETVRSFAHNGVRFIPGEQPKKHWLAKNWAYHQLLESASGEYVMFCGVDVRFKPDSLRLIVQTLIQKKKSMISIMPDYNNSQFQIRIVQAMRYFWELAPPRRLFNRPPVLSTCWISRVNDLKKIGGFNAVTRAVVPESFFARTFIKTDKYSFLRSDRRLGVSTYKKLSDQRDTFIRVRYPQLHKKPQLVFIVSLIELILLVVPFSSLLIAPYILHLSQLFWILNLITCLLLLTSYAMVVVCAFSKKCLLISLVFPITILVDVVLLNFSMYEYEMSVVSWKSRNVCIPTMHFTPSPSRN